MTTALFPAAFPASRAAALALAVAACCGAAQADTKLVPAGSEIVFVSKQMGVPVEGRFKKFDAQVNFDPRQPAKGSINLAVDLASVSMAAPEVRAELVKPEWFDTARFPKATFQSTAIKAAGPAKFEVTGKLAIKGFTHDAVVPVALVQAGGVTTAAGSFTLKRLAYKVGGGDWADPSLVADDVQVKFKLVLSGLPPL